MAPRKSQITVASRASAARNRTIADLRDNPVLAKRLQSGNLGGGGGTADLPLKEREKWYLRRDNQQADPNMFYRLRHELGYVPVTPDDLPEGLTPDAIGCRVTLDGQLAMGDGAHEERWFKMSAAHRAMLDDAATTANNRGIGSAKKIKQDAAEAAAGQFGSEAGDFVDSLDGQVFDAPGL